MMLRKFYIIFFVTLLPQALLAQSRTIDSLKSVLSTSSDSIRVLLLNRISTEYDYSASDTALYYAFQAKSISENMGWQTGLALSYNRLAFNHMNQGKYDIALDELLKAQRIFEAQTDLSGIGATLNLFGSLYAITDQINDALIYFKKSLSVFEQLHDSSSISREIGNIGIMYQRLGNIELALEYLFKSIQLREKIGDSNGVAIIETYIARTYQRQGDDIKALEYFFKSIKSMETQYGNEKFIAIAYRQVGVIYCKQKKYTEASSYIKKSLRISERGGFIIDIRECYKALADLYLSQKDISQALAFQQKYIVYKDSTYGIETAQKLAFLQAKNEIENQERQIKLLKQENEIQELELQTVAAIRRAFLIGFFLVCVFALLAFKEYRYKLNSEKLLREKNNELENQAKELDRLAKTDGLTGLFNRRHFSEQIKREFERSLRYNTPLTVAMGDIDFFKKVNDTYSHQIGDEVLRAISKVFMNLSRKTDFVSRYGGEEFIFLFPETTLESAVLACEKIRKAVEDYNWDTIQQGMKITISIGVSADKSSSNIEKMIALADEKLYEAKYQGRNQVRY